MTRQQRRATERANAKMGGAGTAGRSRDDDYIVEMRGVTTKGEPASQGDGPDPTAEPHLASMPGPTRRTNVRNPREAGLQMMAYAEELRAGGPGMIAFARCMDGNYLVKRLPETLDD